MNDTMPRLPAKPAGLFEATLHKLFARTAKVVDVVDINAAFRLITFGGDALRNVDWTPGDKIQVQLGGWVQRTYTPIEWDSANGRTRILVVLHAGGPAAHWAHGVRPGDAAVLFGPRKSIALAPSGAPTVLLGDETSLGLAAALTHHGSAPAVHVVLEAAAPADTAPVLARLGLSGARLCVRRADDGHIPELVSQLSALLPGDAPADLVLTGRAATIQAISRELKGARHPVNKRYAKAYWATGKTGLD